MSKEEEAIPMAGEVSKKHKNKSLEKDQFQM
jgi:hypothetical protein